MIKKPVFIFYNFVCTFTKTFSKFAVSNEVITNKTKEICLILDMEN